MTNVESFKKPKPNKQNKTKHTTKINKKTQKNPNTTTTKQKTFFYPLYMQNNFHITWRVYMAK